MHITNRQRVDVIIAALDAYAYDRRDLGAKAAGLTVDANTARQVRDAAGKQEGAARAIRAELSTVDMPAALGEAIDKTKRSEPRNLGRAAPSGRPQLHLPA